MKLANDGEGVRIRFEAAEAGLLTVLAHQFADVIRDPELDDAPLLARLFPDAYRGDAGASDEFRRYTRDELEDRKTAAAERIAQTATEGWVALDHEEAETWARSLTDLRVMVGTRLGIREDGDEPDAGPLTDVYHFLGELQWVLVELLEAP
ncbi:DUF2017 family protein [Homoserinibacter sp. GY 40078]|uniref:DUF2017 family protein n=1 Tax=Homoserinibacter sp. GY 40078 TaxID=2603275 RepID=UPI0011C8D77A|nr:DUF2017 family protein [Homoserinibacter sp. GY 40078]TXK19633.1 DUF2017 family protein [Homoserinibacter sp. GY 40078]